jgi:hypothetical protein
MSGLQKAAGPLPVLHAPWDSVSLAPSSELVVPVFFGIISISIQVCLIELDP